MGDLGKPLTRLRTIAGAKGQGARPRGLKGNCSSTQRARKASSKAAQEVCWLLRGRAPGEGTSESDSRAPLQAVPSFSHSEPLPATPGTRNRARYKGHRLRPGARVRDGPHHMQRPLRRESKSSYLGGVGMGDPAASPRLRKAARTLSVSSRSPSSSEPAMGAPVREGAEG